MSIYSRAKSNDMGIAILPFMVKYQYAHINSKDITHMKVSTFWVGEALPMVKYEYAHHSRAFTMASLASTAIWASARAASSDTPTMSAWAFSRLALAACKTGEKGYNVRLPYFFPVVLTIL